MQIRNILAGQSEQALQGKRAEATGPVGAGAAEPEAAQAAPGGVRAAMAAVLARYDVTDMTPTQFSEMLQELQQSGALSREEFQELAAVRVDLDAAGVKPDESTDLVQFYRQLIAKLERRLEDAEKPHLVRQQLQALRHRLDWMEKFAVVQEAPGAAGLDERV
jgi:hypothetical protein